jgi:hypothetical protein
MSLCGTGGPRKIKKCANGPQKRKGRFGGFVVLTSPVTPLPEGEGE